MAKIKQFDDLDAYYRAVLHYTTSGDERSFGKYVLEEVLDVEDLELYHCSNNSVAYGIVVRKYVNQGE